MISEFSHKDASPWILQAYESKTLHAQCPGPNRYTRLFHSVLKISFSAGILSTKNLAYDNKLLPTVSTQPIRHSRSDSSNSSQYTMPKVSFFTSYLDRMHLRGCEWVAMPCSSCS